MPSAREFYDWYTYNNYKLVVALFLAITILSLVFAVGSGAR